jgi:hypothetical protein
MVASSIPLQPGPISIAPVPAIRETPVSVFFESITIPRSSQSEYSSLMLPSVLHPGDKAAILSVRTVDASVGTTEPYSGLSASASVLYVPNGKSEGQIRLHVTGMEGSVLFRGLITSQETGFFSVQASGPGSLSEALRNFHCFSPLQNRLMVDLAKTSRKGHLQIDTAAIKNSGPYSDSLRTVVLPYLLVGIGLLVPTRGIDTLSLIFSQNNGEWLFFELLLAKLQVAQLVNGESVAKVHEKLNSLSYKKPEILSGS